MPPPPLIPVEGHLLKQAIAARLVGDSKVDGWSAELKKRGVAIGRRPLLNIWNEGLLAENSLEILCQWLGRPTEDFLKVSPFRIPREEWDPDHDSPARVLRAEVQAVSFMGREPELEELAAWCDLPEPFRVRIYWGPGGMGKTRLALELCELRAKSGWKSGFLQNRGAEAENSWHDLGLWHQLVPSGGSLLLVLDYAENRLDAVKFLLESLRPAFLHTHKVRVLLLARSTGDWYAKVRRPDAVQRLYEQHLFTEHRLAALVPLPKDGDPVPGPNAYARRLQVYERAVSDLARKLRRAVPAAPPPNLALPSFDRVLRIQFAAKAAVEGVQLDAQTDTLTYMLERERRFWSANLAQRGLPDVLLKPFEKLVAAVTVGRGIGTEMEALDLLRQLPWAAPLLETERLALNELLHDSYGTDQWAGPLEPDTLGEYLIHRHQADPQFRRVTKDRACAAAKASKTP